MFFALYLNTDLEYLRYYARSKSIGRFLWLNLDSYTRLCLLTLSALLDNRECKTLIIPYGTGPADMKDNQTIQEFLDWNNNKFRPYRNKEEKLKTNKDILRQIKFEELNIQ